nr:MAG TPA: FAM165 family [Caudoviricetes sp.]
MIRLLAIIAGSLIFFCLNFEGVCDYDRKRRYVGCG